MTVSRASLFREMTNYLGIEVAKQNKITIINNLQKDSVQTPQESNGMWTNAYLVICMACDVFSKLVFLGKAAVPLAHALDYTMHKEALNTIEKYKKYQAEVNANPAIKKVQTQDALEREELTQEVIDKYTNLVTLNCSKAKKMLAATPVMLGAALVHEAMSPHSFSKPAVASMKSTILKLPLGGFVSYGMEKIPVGTREMKIVMGVTTAFVVLSSVWHALRAPAMKIYEEVIIDRSGLRPYRDSAETQVVDSKTGG